MKNDPIVAEVRQMRHEHAARFKYDLNLIAEDLKAQEQASGRPYISLPPVRTQPRTHGVPKREPVHEPPGAAGATSGAQSE